MKKFKKILPALILLAGLVGLVGPVALNQPVAAQADVIKKSCKQQGGSTSPLCDNAGKKLFGTNSVFETITNVFLFVVGAISVIMIIFGGFRYATSNGDQSSLVAAKNTILYAVVGLIVALMSFAIVNFVLKSI